jgi:hypothetical protein
MKRLVDETTDELTRSLLAAGIEHRPSPGNKAQVIVALGAGGTLGLFSSNAFAWLGTTAGKVTAAGVAVGVASAVFIAGPHLLESESSAARVALSQRSAKAEPQPTPPMPAVSSTSARSPADRALASEGSPSADDEASRPSGSTAFEGAGSGHRASLTDKAATKKLSAWRERRLASRRRASAAKADPAERSEPAAELAAAGVATAAAPPSVRTDQRGTDSDLDSEVKLVDEMYWAARHDEREALGRFLVRYRETFPDGQLKKEVAEFAARLERSDTSTMP